MTKNSSLFPTQHKGSIIELSEDYLSGISHLRDLTITTDNIAITYYFSVPVTAQISTHSNDILRVILDKARKIIDDPDYMLPTEDSFQYISGEFVKISSI